jgi:hypothetical protein
MPQDTTAQIRLHYRRLGLSQGWPWPRVERLCRLLHCTTDELGALCCIEPQQMGFWQMRGKVPSYVALLFALLESAWWEARSGCACPAPVVPIDQFTPHP